MLITIVAVYTDNDIRQITLSTALYKFTNFQSPQRRIIHIHKGFGNNYITGFETISPML